MSRRVPGGHRAVSVPALVPTGLARGEAVTVHLPDGTVEGTVVSARSTGFGDRPPAAGDTNLSTDGGEEPDTPEVPVPRSPTTDGGDGRVTVAVPREDVQRLLAADRGHLVVRSRGTRREFELLALFRRAGRRIRRVAVGDSSPLDGETIGTAAVRDTYGVGVLAVRGAHGWSVAPAGGTRLEAGDELFVVGSRADLDRFEGVAR